MPEFIRELQELMRKHNVALIQACDYDGTIGLYDYESILLDSFEQLTQDKKL